MKSVQSTTLLSKTKKSLCVALFSVYLLGIQQGYCQELPFTHYTKDNEVNPIPSADVRSVYQDRLGYVWIVVYSSGLLRCDGHRSDLYTVGDGLPDLSVRQVLEDKLGRLWVASNAGLAVSEEPLSEYGGRLRIRFITKIGSIEFVQTTILQNRMAFDARGSLWVGTHEDGIIRYHIHGVDSLHADTVKTDIYTKGKNIDISSITSRRDGSIWVSVYGGDLLVFKPDTREFDRLAGKDGLPRSACDALYENQSGALYGGCQNGYLWALVEAGGHRRIEIVSKEQKNKITSITEEQDGTHWIATDGSGVMRIAGRVEKATQNPLQTGRVIYTKKNGLLSDNVSNVMVDREGNLWFAQLGGVSRLRADYAAYSHYTSTTHAGEKPLLPDPSINAVVRLTNFSSPAICVATSEGGVAIIKENLEVETIKTDRGLRNNWVNALAVDRNRRLWIGTQTGINCLSLDSRYPPPHSPEVRSVNIFDRRGTLAAYRKTTISSCKFLSLPEDTQRGRTVESLWLPGYQTLYCFVENEWIAFSMASGLPATFFHAVALDEEGRLWLGTRDRGLYCSIFPITLKKLKELPKVEVPFFPDGSGGKFCDEIITSMFEQKWDRSNGAPSNQIETLAWHEGVLWVGTPDGLAILEGDPPRMTSYLTIKDGLRANNITSFAFSPLTGRLWVGTNGGLAEIDPKTRKVLRTITKQDGLVDNEVWYYGSVVIGEDGAVYFGTAKGLSLFRPQLEKRNAIPPPLWLRQSDLTEDNSGNNEIAFEYAGLSFANEKLVRYKSRLVGYDKDWSPEKAEVKIRYTNLPAFFSPKTYTFELSASNNDGLWAREPLRYSFAVHPPWWFRWWAVGSYAIIATILLVSVRRYESKKHIEKAENERRVKELEEARVLQLSMLPKELPHLPHLEVAAYMKTATEVGGDYYDFDVAHDETLTMAIGDATGHGLNAGMVVTATKSVFKTLADGPDLIEIFARANDVLRSMNVRKLYMTLLILKVTKRRAKVCAVGMPPLLLYRAANHQVEEILVKGMPLGSVLSFPYQTKEADLFPGDVIVLMTDGFPERFNEKGEILDYNRAKVVLNEAAHRTPNEIIESFVQVSDAWGGERPQDDDMTFVVLKMKDPIQSEMSPLRNDPFANAS